MRHLRKECNSLSEELVAALSRLPASGSFALLLSHEYTKKSVKALGSGALKGVDRARLRSLEEANKLVDSAKKLFFLMAQLSLEVGYYDDGGTWRECTRQELISWYSLDGAQLKRDSKQVDPMKLNFLNPGKEKLSELWKSRSSEIDGYLGNEGATKDTTYSQFVIVAWPAPHAVKNALKYVNADAAVGALHLQQPLSAAALRKFMDTVKAKTAKKQESHLKPTVSVNLCRGLCDALVSVEDPKLVNVFFSNFVARAKDKKALTPSIIAVVNKFDWKKIDKAVLKSELSMEVLLQVVDGLETGAPQSALLHAAVTKASTLTDEELCSSKSVPLLWKWIICIGDKKLLAAIAKTFKKANPRFLQPVIDAFTKNIDASTEKFAVFASIAAVRITWLKGQLRAIDQPFSWEMPDAVFKDSATVEAFLRGPKESMNTSSARFEGIQHARNYASKYKREKQLNASFELEAHGRGGAAFVKITKTKAWFSKHQKELKRFKIELQALEKRFGGRGNPRKRARVD